MTVITLTTVGYGEVFPLSPAGRGVHGRAPARRPRAAPPGRHRGRRAAVLEGELQQILGKARRSRMIETALGPRDRVRLGAHGPGRRRRAAPRARPRRGRSSATPTRSGGSRSSASPSWPATPPSEAVAALAPGSSAPAASSPASTTTRTTSTPCSPRARSTPRCSSSRAPPRRAPRRASCAPAPTASSTPTTSAACASPTCSSSRRWWTSSTSRCGPTGRSCSSSRSVLPAASQAGRPHARRDRPAPALRRRRSSRCGAATRSSRTRRPTCGLRPGDVLVVLGTPQQLESFETVVTAQGARQEG